MTLFEQLHHWMRLGFKKAGVDPSLANLEISQRPDLADLQCNGALTLSATTQESPHAIASRILPCLPKSALVERVNIAGPGFINLRLSNIALAKEALRMSKDRRLGIAKIKHPKRILLDFGGMNIAKPMHVGHLRSSLVGDCLQRLLKFYGQRVKSDVHLGDWGTQMGLIIAQLKEEHPNWPYFDPLFRPSYPRSAPVTLDQLQRLYPTASAKAKTDPTFRAAALAATVELQQGRRGYRALWKHLKAVSLSSQRTDMEELGIHFDWWKGESDVNGRMKKLIPLLQKKKTAVLSDGAWIIPLPKRKGEKELPPLLLVKSDGAYLYATSDLATIEERLQRIRPHLMVYVVDQRQSLHFKQLFRACEVLSWSKKTKMIHVGFGTMNGPDGKPFKTRSGGVMTLSAMIDLVKTKARERILASTFAEDLPATAKEDIVRGVALATLKFADLSHHRSSDYMFDLDRFSAFEGKTGPYLLYTLVRVQSILKKAKIARVRPGAIMIADKTDRALVFEMMKLKMVCEAVLVQYTPHLLCDHAFALAQQLNHFYDCHHVLSEKNRNLQRSWLALLQLSCRVLELELLWLGIPTTNVM